jgi:hypothetical protein
MKLASLWLNRNAFIVIEFNCASSYGGWNFHRKYASQGTTPFPNNETAA